MEIRVIDVHKKSLQARGYDDFNDWASDPKHFYIGRNVCYVQGTFKSKYDSDILTEHIKFYAFDSCIMCQENINLELISKDLKQMSRD